MSENTPQYRVNNNTALLMVGVAVILDLLSLIPWFNILVSVAAACIFGFWFYLKGLGLISPKKLATQGLATIGESIPVASVLPLVTAGVIIMIAFSRFEDKTGVSPFLVSGISQKSVRLGGRGEIPGGRSKVQKFARRATQSPEFRREARARLARIKNIKERRAGSPKTISDVTPSYTPRTVASNPT